MASAMVNGSVAGNNEIQKWQIKMIFATGHSLGIVTAGSREDDLHLLVEGITGKDSVKELSFHEANAVIAKLRNMKRPQASPQPQRPDWKEHKQRPGGITSGQQKKVWYLMYELKKCDEVANNVALGERLCKIIKKEMKLDALAKDPFTWMTFSQGNTLIEILKKYLGSAQKKRGESDGITTG